MKRDENEFWNYVVDLDEKIINEFEEILNNKHYKEYLEVKYEAR